MDNEFFQRDTNVARIGQDGSETDNQPEPDTDQALRDIILENAKGPKRVQGDPAVSSSIP